MPEYLPVDSLTRPGFAEGFYSGVLAEVVPELIARGVLQGKTVRGKQLVLADDALDRVLQLGIEPLVYEQQGWSFCAVLAPADDVLEAARDLFDVVESRQGVKVHPIRPPGDVAAGAGFGAGRGAAPPDDVRPLYLLKPRASDWTVLLIRLHWFTPADAELAQSFARDASRRLKTRAVAAFADDVSGSYAQEWSAGEPGPEWSTDDDGFYLCFYERGIAAPSSWMGVLDGRHAFMSGTPEAIERVDFLGVTDLPKKPPAGLTKIIATPDNPMTGEDLLAQFARAIGAPVSKAKQRAKSDGPKASRKKSTGRDPKKKGK